MLAVLECRFWVWLNPKMMRLIYWMADHADKVGDYETRESLYRSAEGIAQAQRDFQALLRWYREMH